MMRSAAETAPAAHVPKPPPPKPRAAAGLGFANAGYSQQQTAEHQRQDRPGGHRVASHGKLLAGIIRGHYSLTSFCDGDEADDRVLLQFFDDAVEIRLRELGRRNTHAV